MLSCSTTTATIEPHVGCVFQVDFYGYDKGDLEAKVTFKAHPPTGDAPGLTDGHCVHW